jgi:hypothetical protein
MLERCGVLRALDRPLKIAYGQSAYSTAKLVHGHFVAQQEGTCDQT